MESDDDTKDMYNEIIYGFNDRNQSKILARQVFWCTFSWNVMNVVKMTLKILQNNKINFVSDNRIQETEKAVIECIFETNFIPPIVPVKLMFIFCNVD